jgi:hypothetical protein
MRTLLWAMTLPLCVSGCVSATQNSADAICSGTRDARADHAAALADTQDERTLMTGARLIRLLDSGCSR